MYFFGLNYTSKLYGPSMSICSYSIVAGFTLPAALRCLPGTYVDSRILCANYMPMVCTEWLYPSRDRCQKVGQHLNLHL